MPALFARRKVDIMKKHIILGMLFLSIGLLFGSIASACGGFFCTNTPIDQSAERIIFMINNDERFMGMGVFRRCLLYYHAKGTVLEMAAGTGRNCSFYPSSVDRVVLTDTSNQMLDQARRKITELQGDKPQFAVLRADSGQLQFADNSFDTVVDTFGLCSFDDPVAVLKEMERVCKPDGKILLLEHGRSKSWQWVTKILDDNAERHAMNWGCVHNRDLDRILEESGLILDKVFTWHFGTTYYCVCRPNKDRQAQLTQQSAIEGKGWHFSSCNLIYIRIIDKSSLKKYNFVFWKRNELFSNIEKVTIG